MVCDRNESIVGPLSLHRSRQHEKKKNKKKKRMERVNSFVGLGTSRKDHGMAP